MNGSDSIVIGGLTISVTLFVIAIFLIGIAVLIGIIAGVVVAIIYATSHDSKYEEFVMRNSVALQKLVAVNKKYNFHTIQNHNMRHSYDNEDFYPEITCKDYLIYELVDKKDEVLKSIYNVLNNRGLLKQYNVDVDSIRQFGEYQEDIGNLKLDKLIEIEENAFEERIKHPKTTFEIRVQLVRTNINDKYQESKSDSFDIGDLLNIIERINNKNGSYYRDREIWDSICRVERGKVSNKLRFFILDRDHRRCRICGSTNNLEIDHIIPISKGGKTTIDNLQTLCHDCNKMKGDNIF